ncbi:dolichyl-phosphate beta-glucosyltransferase [Nonomuraea aurantiaca]|uniref:dolichyl-phosphate beta-glucosyltransferase n=1 Tax=Nonomuraea aurantiaca TaxID=2878562 RepID=UPI001CDA3190|nr:dolichyl-phosphate beta-glucosyltransferase [Nonomuraea aurantiaca]MCA2224404.1 glycosyltransferase family 2 protein [Nonomuraea aurantiaca]
MNTRSAMDRSPAVLGEPVTLATVDIVIPVLNEQKALPGCIRTLNAFLGDSFPLPWRITIVDNGSIDGTWRVARGLTREFPQVHARKLETRGRGAALKAAWRDSPADIVAYMDVDLSTELGALFPMVAALASGHSEVAIGTRLARGARTRRSLRRELVSRGYNALLRYGFGVGFSDAQCGFKAARTDVIRPLLDRVEDDGWFFDTELLLLAEHNGLRVHEVPVDWVEDLDSRVRIIRTAVEDLRGLARVAWSMSTGKAALKVANETELTPTDPTELTPTHPDAVVARPRAVTPARLASFALIAVFSTVLYALLYLPLREHWPAAAANLAALLLTGFAGAETRRWTVNVLGGHRTVPRVRTAPAFLADYAIITMAVLGLPPPGGRLFEATTAVGTYCLLTLLRFAALDRWVFPRRATSKR